VCTLLVMESWWFLMEDFRQLQQPPRSCCCCCTHPFSSRLPTQIHPWCLLSCAVDPSAFGLGLAASIWLSSRNHPQGYSLSLHVQAYIHFLSAI
jgi:hypothetical protein